MKWINTPLAKTIRNMSSSDIVVVDTETTGLNVEVCELLQIAITDGSGSELFSSYIKPTALVWPSAFKVNGITRDMVKNAPKISKVRKEIQAIFDKAKVIVGYNINFDINFLEAAGLIVPPLKFDVMTEFARYRSKKHGTPYRRCRLSECAEYFGHSFTPHNADADVSVTADCFNDMISDPIFYKSKRKAKKDGDITGKEPAKKVKLTVQKKTPSKWRAVVIGLILMMFTTYYMMYLSQMFPSLIPASLNELLNLIQDMIKQNDIWRNIIMTIYNSVDLTEWKWIIALSIFSIGSVMVISGIIRIIIWIIRFIIHIISRIIHSFM